jgi:hypothetical protein
MGEGFMIIFVKRNHTTTVSASGRITSYYYHHCTRAGWQWWGYSSFPISNPQQQTKPTLCLKSDYNRFNPFMMVNLRINCTAKI